MRNNLALAINGRIFRTAKVRDEPYDCVQDAQEMVAQLKREAIPADLFTFMQEIGETSPKHKYHLEWEHSAVLAITSYDYWFKKQIDFKARNKIRKCQKAGVELRIMEFNDECVRAIMGIYNESPLLQGKPNYHFGKDFETMKAMLGTFPDRSEFVGAIYQGELIGFIKLCREKQGAGLMHILSKKAHRDKAPTNALIAKAVEICAQRKLAYLHYGMWSKRGLGVFKMNHAFVSQAVPRYYVPLTLRGKMMLRLKMHHKLRDSLPEGWIEKLADWRDKWNGFKYRV